MRFFKNGCNGGDGKFLLEMGGGVILKCGDGKFLKSLNIVGRGRLTPYFMKTYITYPLPSFSNFVCPPPHPTSLSPNTYLHCSFHCPVSLAEWVIMTHLICTILLNDNYGSTYVEHWYLTTRKILMCVLYNKASSLLKPDT